MPDREKLVIVIERAKEQSEEYGLDRILVDFKAADMILELLKEQEPVKVRHLHAIKVSMHEKIVFADECGNCSGYLLKPWKACPICGKPVKWDEGNKNCYTGNH